jgi:hypothetical protein
MRGPKPTHPIALTTEEAKQLQQLSKKHHRHPSSRVTVRFEGSRSICHDVQAWTILPHLSMHPYRRDERCSAICFAPNTL